MGMSDAMKTETKYSLLVIAAMVAAQPGLNAWELARIAGVSSDLDAMFNFWEHLATAARVGLIDASLDGGGISAPVTLFRGAARSILYTA
jgi:hypothetical protein